jgi:hypothetical protein
MIFLSQSYQSFTFCILDATEPLKGRVQTKRVNPIFAPIAKIKRVLDKNKSGDPINIDQISASVTSEGFKPSTATAVMWYSIQLNYEAKIISRTLCKTPLVILRGKYVNP